MTLVELAPDMIELSRKLNPGSEHHQGDMRTVRLGRKFDAVFIHDAICYMTTEIDLAAAIETAAIHCRTGGSVLLAPDHLVETYEITADHGGTEGPGPAAVYLELGNEPIGSTVVVDYVYALRDSTGELTIEHDRHIEGLFPRSTWLRLMDEAGFDAVAEKIALFEDDLEVFVGRKR